MINANIFSNHFFVILIPPKAGRNLKKLFRSPAKSENAQSGMTTVHFPSPLGGKG
jgi:hypothetical protein